MLHAVCMLQGSYLHTYTRVTYYQQQIDDAAIKIIQSNIRKSNIINQWSWWKLLNKIKPLMVVRKTEAEKKEIAVSLAMTVMAFCMCSVQVTLYALTNTDTHIHACAHTHTHTQLLAITIIILDST